MPEIELAQNIGFNLRNGGNVAVLKFNRSQLISKYESLFAKNAAFFYDKSFNVQREVGKLKGER